MARALKARVMAGADSKVLSNVLVICSKSFLFLRSSVLDAGRTSLCHGEAPR